MTKKKNENITEESNKESFFYKYKNDKKFNAKVQLLGYTAFIVLIILFANLNNPGNSYANSNLGNTINSNNDKEETTETLLEQINTNYQYDINIKLTKTTDEILNYHYYGKSYDDTLEINKEFNNTNNTYYKVDDYYYKKEADDYIFAGIEEIYDLIDNNYIELNKVLEYINESSLDHVTDYSNGKKESQYHLYLRDIIINNKTEDVVTINVVEESEILNITIDYTNLLKIMNNEVKECIITYTYTNIDKIEEFHIIEETKVEE